AEPLRNRKALSKSKMTFSFSVLSDPVHSGGAPIYFAPVATGVPASRGRPIDDSDWPYGQVQARMPVPTCGFPVQRSMTELMTKGAIIGDSFGGVAVHTARHAGGYLLGQDIPLIYWPMATKALPAASQVAGMTEEDKLRHSVDSHPFHPFLPLM